MINQSLKEFIKETPVEIQEYLQKSKTLQQSKSWHPEGDAYTHIKIVFNRAIKLNDINLIIAAVMHDLGKVDVTIKRSDDIYNTYGHENVSAKLVEKYRDWIESLGANYEIVHYVVKNHMKAKLLLEMRSAKRRAFQTHRFYRYIMMFIELDNMQIDYSDDLND